MNEQELSELSKTRLKLGLLDVKEGDRVMALDNYLPPSIMKGTVLTVVQVGIGASVKTSSGLEIIGVMLDKRYEIVK